MRVSVSITITTFNEIYKILEPYAPTPDRRLNALKKLKENGIKTSIRVDPIIPFVNDDINEIEGIIETVHNFCDQVIVSTLKLRPDSIKKISREITRYL